MNVYERVGRLLEELDNANKRFNELLSVLEKLKSGELTLAQVKIETPSRVAEAIEKSREIEAGSVEATNRIANALAETNGQV